MGRLDIEKEETLKTIGKLYIRNILAVVMKHHTTLPKTTVTVTLVIVIISAVLVDYYVISFLLNRRKMETEITHNDDK